MFYILTEDELPAGYNIIPTLSDSGDECHREVTDISNNRLKKAFKGRPIGSFYICDEAGARVLGDEDIERFRQLYG